MKRLLTLPLATSLLLAVASPSQSLAKYQDEHLLKLRDELIPLVEKITGERFQAPPQIRSIGPAHIKNILAHQFCIKINLPKAKELLCLDIIPHPMNCLTKNIILS